MPIRLQDGESHASNLTSLHTSTTQGDICALGPEFIVKYSINRFYSRLVFFQVMAFHPAIPFRLLLVLFLVCAEDTHNSDLVDHRRKQMSSTCSAVGFFTSGAKIDYVLFCRQYSAHPCRHSPSGAKMGHSVGLHSMLTVVVDSIFSSSPGHNKTTYHCRGGTSCGITQSNLTRYAVR